MVVEWFTILGAIGAVAAKIGPIIGGGKAAYDLYKHYTKLNHIGELRKALQSAKKDIEKAKDKADEDSFLDFWLSRGEFILPLVKQKLIARFVFSIMTIIAIQIGGDTVKPLTEYDTSVNFVQAFLQILSGSFMLSVYSFKKEEKLFLSNLEILQRMFYDSYVLTTVQAFNKGIEKIVVKPIFNTDEWKRIYGPIYKKWKNAKKEIETENKLIENK